MDSTELLEAFRNEAFDTADPPLWTDEEIFSYMDDAQKMLCRLTLGLSDSTTPSIVNLTLLTGQKFTSISPLILKVRSAQRDDNGRWLDLKNLEDYSQGNGGYGRDDYGQRGGTRLDGRVGNVCELVLGMERNKVRAVPVPQEDTAVTLSVYRLPLVNLTEEDQALEVDEQHHRSLLIWMKSLAHRKQDAETFDKGRADGFEAQFRAYCAKVKEEQERTEHKPRLMGYGGI